MCDDIPTLPVKNGKTSRVHQFWTRLPSLDAAKICGEKVLFTNPGAGASPAVLFFAFQRLQRHITSSVPCKTRTHFYHMGTTQLTMTLPTLSRRSRAKLCISNPISMPCGGGSHVDAQMTLAEKFQPQPARQWPCARAVMINVLMCPGNDYVPGNRFVKSCQSASFVHCYKAMESSRRPSVLVGMPSSCASLRSRGTNKERPSLRFPYDDHVRDR
jgi:hypothetical protein